MIQSNNNTPPVDAQPIKKEPIGTQISTAALARFVLNTARRFAYPFAPALSRGLDVPITAIASLIAINQVTAILGVFFGPLIDRWGYRRIMMVGMALMIVGMFSGGFVATYLFVFLAMLIAGLGKSMYDPAIQAFIGKKVAYKQRAKAVGFSEMSWAGSSLIGIPAIGMVMQWAGWQAAFWLLGCVGVICLVGLYYVLPFDDNMGYQPNRNNRLGNSRHLTIAIWKDLIRNRPALGMIGFGFFFSLANDSLFVVFGAWMESTFGLGLSSLGFATAVIGIAELAGESLTVLFSDRVGLRRAAITGAVMTTIAYLLLMVTGQSLTLALVVLFIVFLTFEFTIVTCISLSTELHPSARATMMAGYYAFAALGRVGGALSGGLIWTFLGWHSVCLFSAILNALGVVSLAWGIRNWNGNRNTK